MFETLLSVLLLSFGFHHASAASQPTPRIEQHVEMQKKTPVYNTQSRKVQRSGSVKAVEHNKNLVPCTDILCDTVPTSAPVPTLAPTSVPTRMPEPTLILPTIEPYPTRPYPCDWDPRERLHPMQPLRDDIIIVPCPHLEAQ